MIEKRFVQWYASDTGVDLDIAEREVVLTYVLRILCDEGVLDHLAFKGGTAIRKLHLGSSGRFSLDHAYGGFRRTRFPHPGHGIRQLAPSRSLRYRSPRSFE